MRILKWMDQMMMAVLKSITILCFILLTVLITASIVFRFIPVASLLWSEEIITLLFAYLVFYGAAALWISREHICVGDWFERRALKNERGKHIYRLILEMLVFIFTGVFVYYSFQLTVSTEAVTNVLAFPKRIIYSCMPVSGAIMVIYSLRNIAVEIRQITKPKRNRSIATPL